MAGLSDILEVARRALMSQRIGMDVTSHNIANANTLGYSRQTVDFEATTPMKFTFGFVGTGTTVSHIGRMRDQFIDRQMYTTNSGLGDANVRSDILSQVESTLNEPSDAGLNSMLGKFFTSFQDLSLHPEDSGARTVLLQQGQQLTQAFRNTASALDTTAQNLATDVNQKISQVNDLTKGISDLDSQITNALSQGLEPADLQDQRDQKIEQLSKLVNVSVSQDSSGSTMVSVGGTVVASRGGAVRLTASLSGGSLSITSKSAGNQVAISSGEIGGELNLYNTVIPGYHSKLDQLASGLINRVNTLHAAGYGLGTPPPTGNNFFTGTSAATIGIDPAISSNVNNIAASGDGTPGNNANALAIAGVQNEMIMNGNTTSVSQFYSGLVSDVGSAVNTANTDGQAKQAIYSQLDSQRSSVSGVSLDEEMTNTIKFQQSYDAAAKVITTVNDMFVTLINMKAT